MPLQDNSRAAGRVNKIGWVDGYEFCLTGKTVSTVKTASSRKPEGAASLSSLVTNQPPYKTINSSLLKVMCFNPLVETRKVFSMPTAPRPG